LFLKIYRIKVSTNEGELTRICDLILFCLKLFKDKILKNRQLLLSDGDKIAMILAQTFSGVIQGIRAYTVEVEVQVSKAAQHNFQIIGLADSAIREAKERVVSALHSSGFSVPERILVNLAPADLKKEGSVCDLAIAIAILIASQQLILRDQQQIAFFGELALDGRIKPINGSIAHCLKAFESGIPQVIIPIENLREASIVSEIESIACENLSAVVDYLRNGTISDLSLNTEPPATFKSKKLLSEVQGQDIAKRALTIAAAGGHNVLFVGTPGCGKSMLAERFGNILPELKREEMLEVVKMHSIAGYSVDSYLSGKRPFRSPHHGISQAGLIGGGSTPQPGEISLAHHGILFLDEFPEFKRVVIEGLRSPLENATVRISRAKGSEEFPAQFQLIAAMNPCPCGRLGLKNKPCLCSPSSIYNYLKKISQPILDRIDLHVDLKPLTIDELSSERVNKSDLSDSERQEHVASARQYALKRQNLSNAKLANTDLLKFMSIQDSALKLLKDFIKRKESSARSYFRTLKLARTIADLEFSSIVGDQHVIEALGYRSLDVIEEYVR
jgi:magnesium chelatase family protein